MSTLAEFCAVHAPVTDGGSFPAGTVFGDWRVTAFIGRGGNGEVYCAEHVALGTSAAVKVLVRKDERAKHRFVREAALLAKMRSNAFPRFMAFGEANGCPYLAMELLEPGELPTGDRAVAKFMLKVCEAVGELHGLGYVHRDIKPGNVLWRNDGSARLHAAAIPVLADLGIVKEINPANSRIADSQFTVGGVGTPGYGAPEQMERCEATTASDIHALGVLADRCFGGNPPRAWKRIIERATSSISAHRYPSVSAFARAIRWRNLPLVAAVCASFAIALVAVAIFVLPDDRGPFLSKNDDSMAEGYTNWYARVYGESQLQQEELCRQRAARAMSEAHRISWLRNSGKPVQEDDYVWLEGELKNIVEQLGCFNERWSEIRKRYASSRNSLERAAAETKPITIQLLETWEREIRSCLGAR